MGRDRPTRVEGTPRGLGLYRRQGREGFFFVKNWAHIAKEHPGVFGRNGQFDEWIKRPDGSLIDNLKEAKAYCLRRCAELEQRKLALTQPAIRYSGEDLEGIAQTVSSTWIKAWQRGANLQQLNLDFWRVFMESLQGAKEQEARSPGLRFFFQLETSDGFITLDEEEKKLQRLIWDQGYRPSTDQLSLILMRFGSLVLSHIENADTQKQSGEIQPPRPSHPKQSQTWEGLLKAKEAEDIAEGTMRGITVAITRLQRWAAEEYQVKLPSSIDTEMALEYREFLTRGSSLKVSSARKELRYLSSTFATGAKKRVLQENPFHDLPKDRKSAMRNRLATRKTVDFNNVINAERGAEINRKMLCAGRGGKDPSYDIFILQAMTGARIQEIAGLRGNDFVKRRVGETEYRCIRITAWEERGHGALEERGGLKTLQSDRLVPLPDCGAGIWERYADKNNRGAAFPEERPHSARQPWGERLMKRMREKCKPFKTTAWRETVINNGTNAGISYRAAEMVTGKTGESSVVQYTSDDLAVMKKVVEVNAESLQIEKWLEACKEHAKSGASAEIS
jgi:integrase